MKQLLKQYAWILSICSAIILLLLLTACNQPLPTLHENVTQDETPERSTQSNSSKESSNSIANMESIAHALGCVFAPHKCKSK